MDAAQIARDNQAFYQVAVPINLCKRAFASAVLDSFDQPAQYALESGVYSGYIRIDATDIRLNCSHGSFRDEVLGGLLGKVAMEFPRDPTGDLKTDIVLVHDIWEFSFEITRYERDSEHEYEMVEDPLPLPDDEEIGRFVELKIRVAGSRLS